MDRVWKAFSHLAVERIAGPRDARSDSMPIDSCHDNSKGDSEQAGQPRRCMVIDDCDGRSIPIDFRNPVAAGAAVSANDLEPH